MSAEEFRQNLKALIDLDDEARRIQTRLKEIRDAKQGPSEFILRYMRDNQLDDLRVEGQTGSVFSRQVRTIKPAIKRNTIHTQILLHLADDHDRARQIIRAIEGIPEGGDADGGSTVRHKELLTRRIPKQRAGEEVVLETA